MENKDTEIESLEKENEIVEIDSDVENTTVYDLSEIKEEKLEPKLKPKKTRNKINIDKKKVIIILSVVIGLILISGLVYFFVFRKKNDGPKKPSVVIEKGNYRYQDGTLIFLDKDDLEIGKYECDIKDEKLCFIAKYSNEDNFDIPRVVYENGANIEYPGKVINEKYVAIYDNPGKENGLIKLFNIKDSEVVGKYKLIKSTKENYVILKDEKNKYGVMDLTDGKIQVEFIYDYIGYIKDKEYLVAIKDLQNSLIDFDGNVLTKDIVGEIKNYNDKYVSVKVDNNYVLKDYEGKMVIDENYDYIRFNNDIIGLVNNKKLYLYDDNLNKLNVEGIRLEHGNLEDKITVDKEYNEISREESFKIDSEKDKVYIELSTNNTVEINRHEGEYSTKTTNIDYYDGKLYFYNNEAKENLLGFYECENKNVIDKDTDELTSCFLAQENKLLNRDKNSDNLGYLPIFNNRYVFIHDGSSNILWDLKGSKKLATYKEIDTGFYSNTKPFNYVETANTLVVAKNTNDSLGVIRIFSSNINGVISFKEGNKEIKLLNDHFLVKRKDNTYHLFTKDGDELTKNVQIKNEIVDFNNNYFKVKDGDSYLLYTKDGKIVETSGDKLAYLKMFDRYFIGINDKNEIALYEYNGKKHTRDVDVIIPEEKPEEEGDKPIEPEKPIKGDSRVIITSDFDKSYKIEEIGNHVKVMILTLDNEVSFEINVTL